MTWAKLDDSFYDDPKVVAAGNEAAGVYCRALSYCGKHLTDGLVPEAIAELIAGKRRPIAKLLEVGLWVRSEDGWYGVTDYLRFNPSKAEVLHKRKVRAEAGKRGGLASANGRSKR